MKDKWWRKVIDHKIQGIVNNKKQVLPVRNNLKHKYWKKYITLIDFHNRVNTEFKNKNKKVIDKSYM